MGSNSVQGLAVGGYNGLVELTKSAEHVDGASGQDNIEHTIHSIVNAQRFQRQSCDQLGGSICSVGIPKLSGSRIQSSSAVLFNLAEPASS
jgi:hypothetical protein